MKIRHIAGKYIEHVQQCTRCWKILVDNRDQATGRIVYGEGDAVTVQRGRGKIAEDAVDCKPMGL